MKRIFIYLLFLVLIIICSQNRSFAQNEKAPLFTGVYKSMEVSASAERPDIEESITETKDGYLLKRTKKKDDSVKLFTCLIDKESKFLKWAILERVTKNQVYQKVKVKFNSKHIAFEVEGKDAVKKDIPCEEGTYCYVPDAIHFGLSQLALEKGKTQKIKLIDWNGDTHIFYAKGKGEITRGGKQYRIIKMEPDIPFIFRSVFNWENIFLFSTTEPYPMIFFKGRQGPFSEEIIMWLSSEDNPFQKDVNFKL